jgi:hypothetical protein
MTALAEKMKSAGVDTIGAKLTAACIEGLRRHPGNEKAAWGYAFEAFGREFVSGVMNDMRGTPMPSVKALVDDLASDLRASGCPLEVPDVRARPTPPSEKPYTPRIIAPQRLAERRRLAEVVRSKYKNSGGIAWSEVGWHELPLLKRDGAEAAALWNACSGEIPNDGRTVGDVLGIKKTDEIIAALRKSPQV